MGRTQQQQLQHKNLHTQTKKKKQQNIRNHLRTKCLLSFRLPFFINVYFINTPFATQREYHCFVFLCVYGVHFFPKTFNSNTRNMHQISNQCKINGGLGTLFFIFCFVLLYFQSISFVYLDLGSIRAGLFFSANLFR